VIPHAEQRLGRDGKEAPDGITLIWEYDRDLFEGGTIERMAREYRKLLETIVDRPDLRIDAMPLLDEAERAALVAEPRFGDTSPEGSVTELFEIQAERNPDAPAARFRDETLSYGELNRRANRLARTLRRRGVGPEARVA